MGFFFQTGELQFIFTGAFGLLGVVFFSITGSLGSPGQKKGAELVIKEGSCCEGKMI